MGLFNRNLFSKRSAKKNLDTPLTLTSLVDAFSILVIFLIVSGSNPSNFKKQQNLQLPKAQVSDKISTGLKVSILGNQYFLDNKKISLKDLERQISTLALTQKNPKAILEADKHTLYEAVEPIMKLFSDLKVETIQLAVNSKRII